MAMQAFNSTYSTDNSGRTGGSTQSGYEYDSKTGAWVPTSKPIGEAPTDDSAKEDDKVPDSFKDGDSSSQTDTKTSAEKEYIDAEMRTLEGEAVIMPSAKALKLKVNSTVRLEGIGKYLSGDYFISGIKRSISKDGGYSQTLTVIKNGFGESLKKVYSNAKGSNYRYSSDSSDPIAVTTDRKETVAKTDSPLKEGDKVMIVGDNAVYSNAHEGVKVPAWVKKKTLTVQKISSDGNRVLLMPIFSWTYVSFVKKV